MVDSPETGADGLSTEWPGVHRAYDFVLPSYQLLAARFEAADNRLTSLLTLASSVTLGMPVLVRGFRPNASFDSNWFRASVLIFTVAVIVGAIGRVRGFLVLPNPRVLYFRSLKEDDWLFKKNAIYFAGKHFDQNAAAIRIKGNFALAVTILFLVEALALLAWMAQ